MSSNTSKNTHHETWVLGSIGWRATELPSTYSGVLRMHHILQSIRLPYSFVVEPGKETPATCGLDVGTVRWNRHVCSFDCCVSIQP